MVKTINGVSSYLEKTVRDLDLKVRLLSGQEKVIDYLDSGMLDLLNRELVIYWQSLDIDYISIYKGDISKLPSFTLNTNNISIIKDDISQIASIGSKIPLNILFTNNLIHALEGSTSSYVTDSDNSVMLVVVTPIKKNKEVIAAMAIGVLLDKKFIFSLETFFNTQIVLKTNDINISSKNIYTTIPESVLTEVSKNSNKLFTYSNYIIGHIPTSTIGLSGGHLFCIYNTNELTKQITRYNIISVIISLITLTAAMILGMSFYRSTFVYPFQSLINGINMISVDNIYPPFKNPGNDEFGKVASTFNRMCTDLLQDKKEIERLSVYNTLILDNMKSGIMSINFAREIMTVNPSASRIITNFNWVKGNVISFDFLPENFRILIDSVLSSGNHVSGIELGFPGNSSVKGILVSTSPLRSREGEVIGVLTVFEDITKIKNLENKLEISSRLAAMGEMVAGVAHQIRNPLAVMKVSMEILRDDFMENDSYTEKDDLTGFILKEIDTLDTVVNNFLDFAKPMEGKQNYENIVNILEFAIRSIDPEKYDGITLNKEFEPDLGEFLFDRSLMIQALSNIIINAFQCSDKGDRIFVRAFHARQGLVIEVEDEGKGISEDVRLKMYNPFFTTKAAGTGLGLSIVHRIIEDHNGFIEVESKQKGTIFRLLFKDRE